VRFPLEVRYSDYDTKGHVNNAVYLTYFEMGRVRAWSEWVGGDADPSFIVAAASVRYASPAMLGEALDLEVLAGEVRTKAWVWRYRVTERATGRLVADGETTQVLYDYASRTSVAIPPELRARLAAPAGESAGPDAPGA